MVVTARTFEDFALADPDRNWELHRGRLREKPGMSAKHNWTMFELGYQLRRQLDQRQFQVRVNAAHLHRPAATYYIPDVVVLPTALVQPFWEEQNLLEVYREPLPLVVEVWSPSTGDYDVDEKLPEYMARGDAEIWRLHPFARALKAWRRQPDGTYTLTEYTGGIVYPVALPSVAIDLDALFE